MTSAATSRTPLLPQERAVPKAEDDRAKMSIWNVKSWEKEDWRRAATFGAAIITGLSSGSNYVYSAYAPQLASQLGLSSTQVNVVGVAGNLGMYLSGPVFGKITDSRGQKIPLATGAFLVFVGYSLVRAFYTQAIPIRSSPEAGPSSIGIFFLSFAMFLSGCGGAAGLSAAVNAVAKSFPDSTRASATGLVLAGFGLSAFLFSTVGHEVFPGDAGGLLGLLAGGCGGGILLGALVIKEVPVTGNGRKAADSTEGYQRLAVNDTDGDLEEGADFSQSRSTSVEIARSRSPFARGHVHQAATSGSHKRSTSTVSLSPTEISFTPLQLMRNVSFYALFLILAILCGTGLMYINNVGTVALALARGGHMIYDVKKVGQWQARQVGTVSVWNCLGRILGGVVSDFVKSRFHIRRVWFLPIVALLFIIAQLAALSTFQVERLWIVSTLLGLAYGSLFNVVPMLVLEWFGMAHFSQNYGWICVAPVIGGNLFNVIFGRVYDSNSVGRIGMPDTSDTASDLVKLLSRAVTSEDKHACLLGEACYATAFRISTFGCLVALLCSIAVGVRREREMRGLSRGSSTA